MADGRERPARERPLKLAERKVPARLKETRPPLWSSKVHGVPNKYTPAIQLPERKMRLDVAQYKAQFHGATQVATASVQPPSDRRAAQQMVHHQTEAVNAMVEKIEVDLRRNLRELARSSKLHETEKSILLRTFECFDFERTGKVSQDGCRKALKTLGVPVDEFQVECLFDKFGQDMQRMMPYDVFTNRLFLSRNRELAWTEQRHEAFNGTDTAGDLAFNGKIIYPKGKLGSVYTPTDWDSTIAMRSKLPPDADLQLEFTYGYRSDDTVRSANLFYTAMKEIVYFTAGVGVVFNKEANSQRFFLGHTDDIYCLTLDSTKSICATGQKKPIGALPYACVWDVNSMQELQRLEHSKYDGDPGVMALAFSRDGTLLVSIQKDIEQHITVWDWAKKQRLLEDKTLRGPGPLGVPMVFGIAWNAHVRSDPEKEAQKFDFCTYGVKGLIFWRLPKTVKDDRIVRYGRQKMKKGFDARLTGTGDLPSLSQHMCAAWLPNGDCVSGTETGEIWVWRDAVYSWHSQAHKAALSTLTLRADGLRLLSGSYSGTIIEWNVQGTTPVPMSRRSIPPQYVGGRPPGIKTLDCFPGSEIYIMGSTESDIFEVDADPDVVITGHNGRLDGVAPNPKNPNEFATACYTGRCFVWDSVEKRVKYPFSKRGEEATCVTYSPHKGDEIAVGFATGKWIVYNTNHRAFAHEHRPERESKRNADGKPMLEDQGVACLKYSPQGDTLAVGSYDQLIYLFSVDNELAANEATVNSKKRFRRIGKCVGHSSSVLRLDWDINGVLLQSNSLDYEMLYWWGSPGDSPAWLQQNGYWSEARREMPKPGEQVTEIQRDYNRWHTWTSIIGFPVMGVFPIGWRPEKMNVVAVSSGGGGKEGYRGRMLVAATDYGEVLMFNFPAVVEGGPYYRFFGHSSFVKNVCWLEDDSRVLSVGGLDRSMLQWTVRWKADAGYMGYKRKQGSTEKLASRPATVNPHGVPGSAQHIARQQQTREERAHRVARLEERLQAMEDEHALLHDEIKRLQLHNAEVPGT